MSSPLPLLLERHHRTAQAHIVERLRQEILSGRIPPGTRLTQAELAKRMETSTTPVREAVRELAAEGLLRIEPHREVLVHEPTQTELEEIYELRMLLEPLSVIKTVKTITPTQAAAARNLLKAMERETDPGIWAVLNREFHELIADAAGSPRLSAILAGLRTLSTMYVTVSLRGSAARLRTSNREHREILDACVDGDKARAAKVVRQHLLSTVELARMQFTERGPASR